jgi:deoxyribose-phosphate aldolase
MNEHLESWDEELTAVIDHTVLGEAASEIDVRTACEQARHYKFAAVVVAPHYLPVIVRTLGGSGVHVCSVVSFPSGRLAPAAKASEASELIQGGADEIDAVMNVKAYLDGNTDVVREEIERIRVACGKRAVFKFILETSELNPEQIAEVTQFAVDGGVDFVKTSTGRAARGASVDDVRIISDAAGGRTRIKAAGGIRNADFARELLAAGASRLGCSASLDIIRK